MNNFDLILLVILLTIILICVYFIYQIMWRHRHKLVLREIINNKKVVRVVRFRRYIDKDKTEWFKLYPGGRLLKPAPSQSIDVSGFGSMWVEAYQNENGSITYIEDKHNDGVGFQPLTSSDRRLLIAEIQKAHSRKKVNWKENIPMLASVSALVIIIVMLFVFWGDLAEPFKERDGRVIQYENIQTEQLQILKEIKLGIQRIEDKSKTNTGGVIPD